jgi:hypothetical protein
MRFSGVGQISAQNERLQLYHSPTLRMRHHNSLLHILILVSGVSSPQYQPQAKCDQCEGGLEYLHCSPASRKRSGGATL